MRILFLGTGAADFSPQLKDGSLDGRLDNTERRSASLLVNSNILVDCGPHVPDSIRILGVNPADITDVFITHLHADHFDPLSLARLAQSAEHPLKIHMRRGAKPNLPDGCEATFLSPGHKENIGGVTVTAYAANHAAFPLHYSFESGGRSFFYGCDGAWLLTHTVRGLAGREFDAYIFDSTVGDYEGDYRMGEHNSIPMIRLMLPSLKTLKIIKPDTALYLSHIARTLNPPHAQLCEQVEKYGLIPAHDGMSVTV